MEIFSQLGDFILHFDKHLQEVIRDYGAWTYGILAFIVFAETGFVVTPFLPGDSLLFAAGLFAHRAELNVWILFFLLTAAAILGNSTNYAIGRYAGHKLFRNEKAKFLNPANLAKTHAFFEKHGPLAIVVARFVPFARTFAPCVAGMGAMPPAKFQFYNVVGAVLWVGGFVFAGFLFAEIPVVRDSFSMVVLGIIGITLLPFVFELVRHGWRARVSRKER
ncbi:MAG: DedA family protein [Fimbriimonadaceae bacterium]|nr:DedA family protein [Chthonomonadaceae bacterium]MCO5296172.1 DedA family protein [Fimbriimonadaceae bacterium]